MEWFSGMVIAVAAIAAAPFVVARIREKPLTAEERQAFAPGRAVTLRDGVIHVIERGPKDDPPVVFIHGFSAPSFVFEQNATALEQSGFRVIQFDHFGRGWSDRPRTAYDTDFFDRELIDLLDGLELTQPVGLVGYSMGGVIAAEFTARHPDRVAGLFLLTPAGLALDLYSKGLLPYLLPIPLIGDWIWRVRGPALLTDDPQYADSSLSPQRRLQGDVAQQMKYRGCLPAILATWRHLPMRDCDEAFARAAATSVPIMAVFGGRDPIVGADSANRLQRVAPDARIEIVEQGDHGVGYEHFDVVNPLMIDFFRLDPVEPDDPVPSDTDHPQRPPRDSPSSR